MVEVLVGIMAVAATTDTVTIADMDMVAATTTMVQIIEFSEMIE